MIHDYVMGREYLFGEIRAPCEVYEGIRFLQHCCTTVAIFVPRDFAFVEIFCLLFFFFFFSVEWIGILQAIYRSEARQHGERVRENAINIDFCSIFENNHRSSAPTNKAIFTPTSSKVQLL
jgi:hypothetical protein